jgi:hypothetical protein
LREFFPVANCIIRDVSDGSSDESELFIVNCSAFNEFLNDVQGVAGFFSVFFSSSFVADYRFFILYFDGELRIKSYERVLRQFFWAFYGFENVGCFIMLVEF